jgi:hypothetical protein
LREAEARSHGVSRLGVLGEVMRETELNLVVFLGDYSPLLFSIGWLFVVGTWREGFLRILEWKSRCFEFALLESRMDDDPMDVSMQDRRVW